MVHGIANQSALFQLRYSKIVYDIGSSQRDETKVTLEGFFKVDKKLVGMKLRGRRRGWAIASKGDGQFSFVPDFILISKTLTRSNFDNKICPGRKTGGSAGRLADHGRGGADGSIDRFAGNSKLSNNL